MSLWQVGMVTAFGRGETLALALQKNGFAVRVLDFTQAFAPEYQRGAGPFPIARTNQFPEHAVVTDELRILPRGLTLWLEKGPLELGGTMAEFFNGRHEIVRNLRGGQVFPEFKDDWLRRLLGFWTSPFDGESWSRGVRSDVFPFDSDLGVVPAGKEQAVLNFERFRTLGFDFVATDGLRDVQIESSRLTEIEFGARGQALKFPQWIWCLSSSETKMLSEKVAADLFGGVVREPEWHWILMEGTTVRGSWSAGFPEYSLVLEDIHLPWTYANFFILRWTDSDTFRVWARVPFAGARDEGRRAAVARGMERVMQERLPLAHWKVDEKKYSICPHSPVLAAQARGESPPSWRNWDWIAPETMGRVDFSARFAREALSLERLLAWRAAELKKQGDRRDHAVHAP